MEIRDNVIRKPYFLTYQNGLFHTKHQWIKYKVHFLLIYLLILLEALEMAESENTSRRTVTLVQVHKITIGLPDM